MISVFNEEDIIKEVIENMISNGIELVVLDNGSSDNSYKICESFLGNGILELYRYSSDTYRMEFVLNMLYDLAIKQSPDWIILADADEILESGITNKNLKDAIEQVDSEGYNLIQFNRFDFFMTDDDNGSVKPIKDKLRYYSYLGDHLYRSWKFVPGIRAGVTAGHYPIFPENHPYKIYPKKFNLRHYKYRSIEQTTKKIKDRLRGFDDLKNPLACGLYKKALETNFTKPISHKKLTKYDEDNIWDFNIKNVPYSWLNPPKKEEVFTSEGFLKNPIMTTLEYQKLWLYEKRRIFPRNMRRTPSFIIRKLIQKLKHI